MAKITDQPIPTDNKYTGYHRQRADGFTGSKSTRKISKASPNKAQKRLQQAPPHLQPGKHIGKVH